MSHRALRREPRTDTQVRRERSAAQLLLRSRIRMAPADTVAWLLAVQAQDIGAAPLALRARTRGLTAQALTAARADRSVIRTWGPRGTLHLITRDDLDWLTPLTVRPWLNHAMSRLGQEGITGDPDELARVVERALAGQGPLTKQRFAERLAGHGRPADGQGIVYLAFLAAIHGLAVLGPDAGNRPTYVHAADWLGAPIGTEPDRERALAELARRYLRSHGPAGPEDLAAWSKLPLREARDAFRLAGAGLVEVEHHGRPLWRLRDRPATASARPGPLVLLPAFDEYLLGWRDRALTLPGAYAKRAVPGGGMIKPVVVVDGTVVGTWQPRTREAEFFDGAGPAGGVEAADAFRAELADVGRFLGRTA